MRLETRTRITDVTRRLRETLFPARCVGCGAFDQLLCAKCTARLRESRIGRSGRCGNCLGTWESDGFCSRCEWWSYDSIDGCVAAFDMEGVPRRLVHALKYAGVREAAPLMANEILGLWDGTRFDVAVAVPLHVSRLRERGFNQSAMLLELLGWPVIRGELRRVRKTNRQVGQRHESRRLQVSGAFRYDGPWLQGMRIALVDDVVTSGATARECALELRAAGARSVTAVAFARANFRADAFHTNAHIRD